MSKTKSSQDRIAAIAERTGGQLKDPIEGPVVGPVGAARLAAIMSERLQPSSGKRMGRPSNPAWIRREKVPMRDETVQRLQELAESISKKGRKVSPMQVAAQLLEQSLEQVTREESEAGV